MNKNKVDAVRKANGGILHRNCEMKWEQGV